MFWPNATQYHEAVQNPRVSIQDEELRAGEVARTLIGLPMVWSGNFADVYKMHCPATGNTWALKCFTRQVPGLQDRYRQIAAHLEQAKLPFTVDFQYLEEGIRIAGAWFPALKMRWVEGLTLNRFVDEHLDRPKNLKMLLDLWVKLCVMLREAGIAHADLQHGNVLLVPLAGGSLALRLIDYDGMYVPSRAGTKSGEVGHPAYQHPQRLREGTYSAEVDRFSHLVIYTAIRCLMEGKRGLWQRFNNGDNLVFREADFRRPAASEAFRAARSLRSASTRALVGRLILACGQRVEEVPWIDELFSDGHARALTPEEEDKIASVLAGRSARTRTRWSPARRLLKPILALDRALGNIAGEGNQVLHNILRLVTGSVLLIAVTWLVMLRIGWGKTALTLASHNRTIGGTAGLAISGTGVIAPFDLNRGTVIMQQPSPPVYVQKGPRVQITAPLAFSRNERRWHVPPCGVDLASRPLQPSPVEKGQAEPPRTGKQRLYGLFTFYDDTRLSVFFDLLDDGHWKKTYTLNGGDFFEETKSPESGGTSAELKIKYADGDEQPFAISVDSPYLPLGVGGPYSAGCYPTCLREGTLAFDGNVYAIAIYNDTADGDYSHLDCTHVFVDLNRDGVIEDAERFTAIHAFKLGRTYFRVFDIPPDGSSITIKEAEVRSVDGWVCNAATMKGVEGATVRIACGGFEGKLLDGRLSWELVDHDGFEATTDGHGRFHVQLPEGRYDIVRTEAEGYAPELLLPPRPGPSVSEYNSAFIRIHMMPATPKLTGSVQLRCDESYHFLTGSHGNQTDGDVHLQKGGKDIFFLCLAQFQRGVVDLGDTAGTTLEEVVPPKTGYNERRAAIVGHTYVLRARWGEESDFIIFRVNSIKENSVAIEYYRRNGAHVKSNSRRNRSSASPGTHGIGPPPGVSGDGEKTVHPRLIPNPGLTPKPLRLQPVPPQTIEAGKQLSVAVSVEDAEQFKGKLRFHLGPNAPPGAAIAAKTGRFQWTPPESQPPGRYEIEIAVEAPQHQSDRIKFAITMSRARTAPKKFLTCSLRYSTELERWHLTYYTPESVALQTAPIEKGWILPSPKRGKRMYAIVPFGTLTRLKVLLSVTNERNYFAAFALDDDNRFQENLTGQIEFNIDYGRGKRQPYAIKYHYFYNPGPRGDHFFGYSRACVREGVIEVEGGPYPIVILDNNTDGDYSDLAETEILIDLDKNGAFSDNERLDARSAFHLAEKYFLISRIAPDGSSIDIKEAEWGEIRGRILDRETEKGIEGATLVFSPGACTAKCGPDGSFRVKVPQGRYDRVAIKAEGFLAESVDLGLSVQPFLSVQFEHRLAPANSGRRGTICFRNNTSYHFLTRKKEPLPGGDFYLRCDSKQFRIPQFLANNRFQRGLVDLGDMGDMPLEKVKPPEEGYKRDSVSAVVGHTYVSLAKHGEEGHFITFRVKDVRAHLDIDLGHTTEVEIEYYYH